MVISAAAERPEEGEDALQETFLTLYRKAPDLEASRLPERARLVFLLHVEGALSVNSSGTGVQAEQSAGAVSVRNENGAIRVKGLFGEALTATDNLETTYAGVDFRWPQGPGLAYRLESSYGHLECDFPGTLEDRGSRLTQDGSTGDGAASVSLKSKSGSVRLRAE